MNDTRVRGEVKQIIAEVLGTTTGQIPDSVTLEDLGAGDPELERIGRALRKAYDFDVLVSSDITVERLSCFIASLDDRPGADRVIVAPPRAP